MRPPFRHSFSVLALVLLALACATIHLPNASAHASYMSSNPSDKQVLAKAPSQLTISFVSSILPDPGTFAYVSVNGNDATQGVSFVSATDPTTLIVPLQSNLPNGKYFVYWKSTDADDGGVTIGQFTFFVGTPAASDVSAAQAGTSVAVPDDAKDRTLSNVSGADACGSDSWCAYCAGHPDAAACPKSGS